MSQSISDGFIEVPESLMPCLYCCSSEIRRTCQQAAILR